MALTVPLGGTAYGASPRFGLLAEAATVPGQPANVSAQPGDRSATISWVAPSDSGGSTITGYVATATPGGANCSTTGDLSCKVSGLTVGRSYQFSVVAKNLVGAGSASVLTPPLLIGTPSAPTKVTVVPSDRQLTVSWMASPGNGSSVSSYEASIGTNQQGCRTSGLSCTITGLKNQTQYTVSVVARNSRGSSLPSTPVIGTPNTVPSSATITSVQGGEGSAVVTWVAPSYVGTGITKYVVRSSPGGSTCDWNAGPLSCTVPSLKDGNSYTFSVVADDIEGSSKPSSASASVTIGLPLAPIGLTAAPYDGSTDVSWTPSSGGGTATSFVATSTPGGASCTAAGVMGCTITGLSNGTSYSVSVVSRNQWGTSLPTSPPATVVPTPLPGAPTSVVISAAALGSLNVAWEPPNFVGYGISGYTATAGPGGLSCTTYGGLSCKIPGLTGGVTYTVEVAVNSLTGTGPSSKPSNAVRISLPPGSPTQVVATSGDGVASVSWSAPGTDGGLPINSYQVTSAPGSSTCVWVSGPLTCTVSGLSNGTSYTFTVVAFNTVGAGAPSALSASVVPSGLPGVPGNLHQSDNSLTAVRLAWNGSDPNGAPIDEYFVQTQGSGAACGAGPTDGTCVVGGLNSSSCYQFSVRAHNANGWGAWSGTVQGCTQTPAPPPPTYGPFPTTCHGSGCLHGIYSQPGFAGSYLGQVGTSVTISCYTTGPSYNGNNEYDQLVGSGWITDFYVLFYGNINLVASSAGVRHC